MKKNMIIRYLLTGALCLSLLAGCGSAGADGTPRDDAQSAQAGKDGKKGSTGIPQGDAKAAKAGQDTKKGESGKGETQEEEPQQEEEPLQEEEPQREEPGKVSSSQMSLAERMAGKYSYHLSGEDGEDEYYVMDVVNFGDNLYAYRGVATRVGGEDLETYSFSASEFIPFDSEEMRSTDGNSVDVNELSFSVMANAGRYTDPGHFGTITLTDDGLLFEGFGQEESMLYLKDDRVEDAFRYLKGESAPYDPELEGNWLQAGQYDDLYITFSGADMYLYQKDPSREVIFAAGSCDFHGGSFDFTGNLIQEGGMPMEFSAEYSFDGEYLVLDIQDGTWPFGESSDSIMLARTDRISNVTTMDQVRFDDDSFGTYGEERNAPFYGLWIDAFEESADAEDLVAKLEEKGLPASFVYSCDWENLNKDPYYCVTIGRSETEEEAKKYLEAAKDVGYGSAYVKHTGKRIGHKVWYIIFNEDRTRITPTEAVVCADTIGAFSGNETAGNVTLIVDADTVFDDSCEMEFFYYYQDGDTPLEWFNHINKIKDTEEYLNAPGAMTGIFEADITGNHIDRFYGSFWWD